MASVALEMPASPAYRGRGCGHELLQEAACGVGVCASGAAVTYAPHAIHVAQRPAAGKFCLCTSGQTHYLSQERGNRSQGTGGEVNLAGGAAGTCSDGGRAGYATACRAGIPMTCVLIHGRTGSGPVGQIVRAGDSARKERGAGYLTGQRLAELVGRLVGGRA